MPKKGSKESFVIKARKVHGERFDYSLVQYIDARKHKVKIRCNKHNIVFEQLPFAHLRTAGGCRECQNEAITQKTSMTEEQFLIKAQKLHGNKYSYSHVEWVNGSTKVKIICPTHGEFEQLPLSHVKGFGCFKCGAEERGKKARKSYNQFIRRALITHGDKYSYDEVRWRDMTSKIEIDCPKHGSFWQLPILHVRGSGCSKCVGHHTQLLTVEKVIAQFRAKQGQKYDYSKVHYTNDSTKVEIICPEHGSFWQTPSDHKQGCGCPVCCESRGEKEIRKWLEEHQIDYEREKSFDGCVNEQTDGYFRFDFFLPQQNICIEFDGIQHFKEGIDRQMKGKYQFTMKDWKKLSERDAIKSQFCQQNDMTLVRIAYNQMKRIPEILSRVL